MTDPSERPVSRWARIGGPLAVLVAAASFGSVAVSTLVPSQAERELAAFAPTPERPDPSATIPGIVIHETPDRDSGPTTGGALGTTYAICDGVTYPDPLPAPDAAHSLAHGAVWITYDPDRTARSTVAALSARVADGAHLMMSPHPGLSTRVSLQAWGHRLPLGSPDDPRFEQFILALAGNPHTSPEPDAGCGPAR